MIALYTLIGFSLLSSAFFTCVGIVGIVGSWFGLHIDLDLFAFDEEAWQERKQAKVAAKLAKEEKRALKKELKQRNVEAPIKNDFQKFDIDLDDPDSIIKSTDEPTGTDLASLIQDGADIEFDDLNARLELLGI